MAFTLSLAAFALISTLNQNPPLAEASAVPSSPAPASTTAVPGEVRPPGWELSLRGLQPITTTDPQHVGVGAGLSHTGAYRAAVNYLPTSSGRFGFIHASLGFRVLSRETWQLTFDLEHAQARPIRRGFRGAGWDLDFHDRHQYSIATASIAFREPRFMGLVTGIEAGLGRMQVWRLVSARAGATTLSDSPDPILESGAPVGMLGVTMARPLFWGFDGRAHVRLLGAGHSRGGEVPFAHATAEWEVTKELWQTTKFGRWRGGVTGTHASSPRAVTYFQNGVGIVLRAAF